MKNSINKSVRPESAKYIKGMVENLELTWNNGSQFYIHANSQAPHRQLNQKL